VEENAMKRVLPGLFGSTVLLLLSLIASSFASADSFSRLYVFGDSLSDTGNLASVVGDFPSPYYRNRVTNGPVAVDVLAGKLGLSDTSEKPSLGPSLHLIGPAKGTNYAIAGARARGEDAFNLTAQVTAFLVNHRYVAPSDALYVVIIGGNDLRDARDAPTTEAAEQILDATVSAVVSNLRTLISAGAESFIVTDSPDIGLIPETRLIAEATGNRSFILRATVLSGKYALKLKGALRKLEDETGVPITDFSLLTFTRLLKTTARLFGITNTRDACFSSQTPTFHPDCDNGANFDKFYFFDEIHPTAKVDHLVGEAIFAVIEHTYALDAAEPRVLAVQ
jgi:phospholipase/lecithinase/hemolysin